MVCRLIFVSLQVYLVIFVRAATKNGLLVANTSLSWTFVISGKYLILETAFRLLIQKEKLEREGIHRRRRMGDWTRKSRIARVGLCLRGVACQLELAIVHTVWPWMLRLQPSIWWQEVALGSMTRWSPSTWHTFVMELCGRISMSFYLATLNRRFSFKVIEML